MLTLQRITTEYVELEDRILLAGELGNREAVVVWLTQRLLQRLVPVLHEQQELIRPNFEHESKSTWNHVQSFPR